MARAHFKVVAAAIVLALLAVSGPLADIGRACPFCPAVLAAAGRTGWAAPTTCVK